MSPPTAGPGASSDDTPGPRRPTLHIGGSTEPGGTVIISVSGGTILEYELSDEAQNPTLKDETRIEATFPSYGNYNVTAYVDDGSGTEGTVDTVLSKPVCIAPRPRLTISSGSKARAGTSVTFDARGSEGQPAEYDWTISGPESAQGTGETFSVTFSATGNYEVALRVVGKNGAAARVEESFSVQPDASD
ncbi:PKD domain-containing protein [Salinibacter grassmerensis]|uniref:PKD domain-containing protein n=1 Tax=Salinibacter grassmerensis TaxID=3040353 RepID=UPI0021E82CCC|nr:PKD domain-containing protein [Salinibacter grassmerensis]